MQTDHNALKKTVPANTIETIEMNNKLTFLEGKTADLEKTNKDLNRKLVQTETTVKSLQVQNQKLINMVRPELDIKLLISEFANLRAVTCNGVYRHTLRNGDVYSGHHERGLPDGIGMLQCVNGDEYKGKFVSDPDFDFLEYENNNIFTWEFREGTKTLANGDVYDGNWSGIYDGKTDNSGFAKYDMFYYNSTHSATDLC